MFVKKSWYLLAQPLFTSNPPGYATWRHRGHWLKMAVSSSVQYTENCQPIHRLGATGIQDNRSEHVVPSVCLVCPHFNATLSPSPP